MSIVFIILVVLIVVGLVLALTKRDTLVLLVSLALAVLWLLFSAGHFRA